MKICTLASSSKGNSILVFTDKTRILIDVGITYSELSAKLEKLGFSCADITAVVITHEHSDHIKGVGTLMRKNGTHVYVHANGYEALLKRVGKVKEEDVVQFFDQDFMIGDLVLTPFRLSHDASCCVGYSITDGRNKMTMATDLGVFTADLVQYFEGSKLVVLESNHDVEMLMHNEKYSFLLKNRILGKNGHLSNKTASQIVEKLAHMGVKQVVLAHLSEENNTPEICYNETYNYLASKGIQVGVHINIDIADPYKIGTLYNLI